MGKLSLIASSYIFSIESSCDDTSVAVVDEFGAVLAQKSYSQILTHNKYGGVVPEVASREHFLQLDLLVKSLLTEFYVDPKKIKCVAVTSGPGLVGPLLVGCSYAEGLAQGWGVPLRRVHHLRGHVSSVLLDQNLKVENVYPAIVLLASGGHTQVVFSDAQLFCKKLADTADDAAGECFDKTAKLMGLPYPGGPAIEKIALQISQDEMLEAKKIFSELPKPRSEEGFSFSGLKTAARLYLEKYSHLAKSPAFCWALQETISLSLEKGLERSWNALSQEEQAECKSFILCGGVSANQCIRNRLEQWAKKHSLACVLPQLKYCADNAAMIAAAAWIQSPKCDLDGVYSRIPLDRPA